MDSNKLCFYKSQVMMTHFDCEILLYSISGNPNRIGTVDRPFCIKVLLSEPTGSLLSLWRRSGSGLRYWSTV